MNLFIVFDNVEGKFHKVFTTYKKAKQFLFDQYEKFLFGVQDEFGFVVDWKEFQKEKDEFDNTWRVNDFGWIYRVTLNDDTDWGY